METKLVEVQKYDQYIMHSVRHLVEGNIAKFMGLIESDTEGEGEGDGESESEKNNENKFRLGPRKHNDWDFGQKKEDSYKRELLEQK